MEKFKELLEPVKLLPVKELSKLLEQEPLESVLPFRKDTTHTRRALNTARVPQH